MLKKISALICVTVVFFSVTACSVEPKGATDLVHDVCFTPGNNCTQKIVDVVDQAKKQILVQAFSFTSEPIAQALVLAQKRGVEVGIILDKFKTGEAKSAINYFRSNGIEPLIDYKAAIAHNKVIIIDGHILVTGSFNFTKNAQARNVENLLIIHDHGVAEKYVANWYSRAAKSLRAEDYYKLKAERARLRAEKATMKKKKKHKFHRFQHSNWKKTTE